MNKRLLKKLAKKKEVNIDDAQQAFNVVARYLNERAELSFFLNPWTRHGFGGNRYCITLLENDKFKDILIADTIRPVK